MTSPHRYGPHQPEAAPNAVTVLEGKPPMEVVRAMPACLVEQRARINELARQRGAGEGTEHLCAAKGRTVWLPADPTRDGGAWCPLCHTAVVSS